MVTLYSKPNCPKCMATKRAFDKKGINYNYVDVTKSPDAYSYVVETLGYQAVPVVETDTEHWAGYKEEKIKGLL